MSDEASAIGETGTGGKLPYVDSASSFVQGFKDAVLKPGLKDGELIAPFKTEFGWHVVQVMYHPPDSAQMESLRNRIAGGEDFAQIARDYSEGNEAGKGGDKGWVAPGLIDARLLRAIFETPGRRACPRSSRSRTPGSSCTTCSRSGRRRRTRSRPTRSRHARSRTGTARRSRR